MILKAGIFYTALLTFLGLAACGPLPEPAVILDTSTPTLTLTPSKTPVWFPPTDTPTLAPPATPLPTQEYRPGVGAALIEDDFSDSKAWQTLRNEAGQAAFGKNELSLAVATSKGALLSLRSKSLPANFYLEITATPNLCHPDDIFGLMVRAQSGKDGYRLLVQCGGKLRMERLVHSELVVMQDWTLSGQIPPGGLLPVRLGVWALGRELRIFVNDTYQFSVRDPVWTEGQLGVLVRAAGDPPLTVSFSNLAVYSLDAARIPTLTPSVTPTK